VDENAMESAAGLPGGGSRKQQLRLGVFLHSVEARLRAWEKDHIPERVWGKDGTVWASNPAEAARSEDLTNRLGWLTAPNMMADEVKMLQEFSREIRESGFSQVVLLGMGGSSLAPEVFVKTFGNLPGCPPLRVLDSTDPGSVREVQKNIKTAETLFIVSSKSGGTIETLSFYKFFWEAVAVTRDDPGGNFVAITDPGSPLETVARERNFRRIFSAPPEVGGRYAALTYFGLVPAALIGVDVKAILDRAMIMADACSSSHPAAENPGLTLGAAMGELALTGRDKITLLLSPGISSFGAWVEQLIAESTGKQGTGILPVAGEMGGDGDVYGEDRFFVFLRLDGDENETLDHLAGDLERRGHPMVRIPLSDKLDMGAEFFRWEMATAAAGAVLGVNPFNQPDVEAAKIRARELMTSHRESGVISVDEPVLSDGSIHISGNAGSNAETTVGRMAAFFQQGQGGDYATIMAYIPYSRENDELLNAIRIFLRDRLHVATTVGYGPRFLHSTGQLHKGGKNNGLFIQITHTPASDIPVPGEHYSFGTLLAAQAGGDYQALEESNRRVIRVHLDGDIPSALEKVKAVIEEAM